MQNQQLAGISAMAPQIELRIVEDFAALTAQERQGWDVIVARQAIYTPFTSLFWNETWWPVFGRSSPNVQKRLLIFILSRNGEPIAIFPMVRQTYARFGLGLLRHIKPLGADGNLTELRSGIVSPGHEREAYATLADYFQNIDREWDVITLPATPPEAGDVFDSVSVEHPTQPAKHGFVIRLASDWDKFRGSLKRNIKESIRKCTNSLKRDGIELTFSCLSEPAAIREMLPQFYELHNTRATQQNGNQHRDYFRKDVSRQFADLLAGDPVRSGLRLFILKHGDKLIAARLGFENSRATYLYYSGYDPDYGKYSVPTQLVIDVIKRAIGSGQQSLHLSFGRDVSKTRWGPEEMAYKSRTMFRSSLRGSLAGLAVNLRKRKAPPESAAPALNE